jgi:hypothetical protein
MVETGPCLLCMNGATFTQSHRIERQATSYMPVPRIELDYIVLLAVMFAPIENDYSAVL